MDESSQHPPEMFFVGRSALHLGIQNAFQTRDQIIDARAFNLNQSIAMVDELTPLSNSCACFCLKTCHDPVRNGTIRIQSFLGLDQAGIQVSYASVEFFRSLNSNRTLLFNGILTGRVQSGNYLGLTLQAGSSADVVGK